MENEKNVLVIGFESYMMDMINRFPTDEANLQWQPETNPEHEAFADFWATSLLKNDHVIDFGEDLIFIIGYPLELAKSLFGRMVCDSEFTKKILAEMLMAKYKLDTIEAWGLEERIYFDREFKSKEDIQAWLEEQEWVQDIKKSTNSCEESVDSEDK